MTYGREYQEDATEPVPEDVQVSGSGKIPRYRVHELCRELAVAEVKRVDLARKYGVSGAAITKFAKAHKGQIAEIKAHLDDEFAGLWITRKENRLAALQADFELASDEARASHHEWVKARIQITHAVAEELGQLPNKQNITIGGTVRHELVGVDVSECFPAAEPGGNEEEP